jgi:CubicO group peptidase (beta-lactamase class C family)
MSEATPEQNVTLNLYSGEPQHQVFPRLKELLRTTPMKPAAKAFQFPEGERIDLPARYEFEGVSKSTAAFIEATDTSAVLALKGGEVRFEQYWLTGGRDVHWISWSVAKSFVSALVGIAMEEGLIESIDTPITRYVDSLKGSAYDGVSIKNVLQMSSGARWNEDYSDATSDVHRLGAVMAGDTSLATFVASIVRETEPGSVCQYNSADTQALGLLLVEATGRSIAGYMQEKICEPLGMESPGYWLVDTAGMEMVLGGLILTARDFAKIGELYRNKGRWNGAQIVPEDWVESSVKPDSPHLQVGSVIVGGHVLPLGYGYQWWVPEGNCGEFSAIGVYNQFVYVDPSRDVVIVKLSANRSYGTSPNESENQEMETIEFLRAIAGEMD